MMAKQRTLSNFDYDVQLLLFKMNWFEIETLTTSFCIKNPLITFVEDCNQFVENFKNHEKNPN